MRRIILGRKFSALLLAVLMLIAICAGCSSGSADVADNPAADSANPTESISDAQAGENDGKAPDGASEESIYPLTDEAVTLSMFAATNNNVTNVIGELGNHSCYIKAEEITGIHIDFHVSTTESSKSNFQLMFASGDFTDMIRMGSNSYTNGLAGACDDGYIVDLTDYLEDYASNYYNVLNNDKIIKLDASTDDGRFLGFFQIYSVNGGYDLYVNNGPVILKNLLDELGFDIPSTYEEYHEVLLAFKTEYDLTDPLWLGNTFIADSGNMIGGYDVNNSFYQIDGTVHYGPLDNSFKEYLVMMSQWYGEGILNRDFYTYEDNPKSPANEAVKLSGNAGLFYSDPTSVDTYNNTHTAEGNYYLVGAHEVGGTDGVNHFGMDTYAVKPMGTMTVTTQCENIDLAIQWCDFWYGKVGSRLSNYGIEGSTFEYDGAGVPHWTDYITDNPDGLPWTTCRQTFLLLTQQPGVYKMDMELANLSENGQACIGRWNEDYDGAYSMPNAYSLTADESSEASAIMGDINTLNDETWLKLVTGAMSFDEWDNYLDTIKSLNIEKAISIYQDALDRYYARGQK